jgi:hypothetical protein
LKGGGQCWKRSSASRRSDHTLLILWELDPLLKKNAHKLRTHPDSRSRQLQAFFGVGATSVASLGPDAVFIFIFFFVPHIVGESLIHWLVQVAEEGRPVLLLQRAKEHRWEQRKESYGPEPLVNILVRRRRPTEKARIRAID